MPLGNALAFIGAIVLSLETHFKHVPSDMYEINTFQNVSYVIKRFRHVFSFYCVLLLPAAVFVFAILETFILLTVSLLLCVHIILFRIFLSPKLM